MRADRLVAILMVLQRSGRCTAHALAEELEVSERTIYRDVEALSSGGIPIYTQSGPGGGIALLDSFRTDLTGLTTAELQALLTLTVPGPLLSLGLGADLSSALRKVAAAVPASRQSTGFNLHEKIYIDESEWSGGEPAGSSFEMIRKALWEDQVIELTYFSELGSHAGTITAALQPLGLVAASGQWYLAASREEHLIAVPMANVLSVKISGVQFERPSGFHLQEFWQTHAALRQQQPGFSVEAIISNAALPLIFDAVDGKPKPASEGRSCVRLKFENLEYARTYILGLGGAVEVLAPLALRLSVADYARQITAVYGGAQRL